MHDIAIEDHIFLALKAEFAGFLGPGFAVVFDVILIANSFRTDEALFEIRVDDAGGGGHLSASRFGTGAGLFGADCEVVHYTASAGSRSIRCVEFEATRRTSLDELPQFLNVIVGTMSIVGPRPHAVSHNEQYRKVIDGYMIRHKVKPGITGWAQVNGWRGDTDTEEKIQKRVDYDIDYINRWSLGFDLKIILKTIFVVIIGQNAY